MPGYTVSLLFWIVPIITITVFFTINRILKPAQKKAVFISCSILIPVGFILDLAFAKLFFKFPNPSAVIGLDIMDIPIEEFIFYVTGFWFIILLYVFCDEYFLSRYNRDEAEYSKFSRRIKRNIYIKLTWKSVGLFIGSAVLFTLVKRLINPGGPFVPGYIIFLSGVAYVPYFFFWRVTRRFINYRALVSTVLVTTLISIIWEVTLALPGGYWDYHHKTMIGIFIKPWHGLPIEAVTVWIFSSLIVFIYEFAKVKMINK